LCAGDWLKQAFSPIEMHLREVSGDVTQPRGTELGVLTALR